jgi:hypothetical protein
MNMPQTTKADRSAAAKKAAATRARNQERERSQAAGKRAAETRQKRAVEASAGQAKKAAKGAFSGALTSVRFAGEAVKQAGKVAATSVSAVRGRDGSR